MKLLPKQAQTDDDLWFVPPPSRRRLVSHDPLVNQALDDGLVQTLVWTAIGITVIATGFIVIPTLILRRRHNR